MKIIIYRTTVLLVSILLFLILHQQKISLSREEIKKNREAEQDLFISEIHTGRFYAAHYLNEALAFFKRENLDLILLKNIHISCNLSSLNNAIIITLLLKIGNSGAELKTFKMIRFFESLVGFQKVYDLRRRITLICTLVQKEYLYAYKLIALSKTLKKHSQSNVAYANMMYGIFICLGLLLFLVSAKLLTYRKELKTKSLQLQTKASELEKKRLEHEELKRNGIHQISKIRDEFYFKLRDAEEDVRNKITVQFLNQTFIPELHRCQKSVGNRYVDKEDALLKKYIEELIDTEALALKYTHHLKNCDVFPSINIIDLITIMVKRIANRRGFMANIKTYFKIDFDLIEHSAMINLFHTIAEVLEHCVKPAKATVVTLEFRIEKQSLVVTIRDNEQGGTLMSSNGIGFMYTYDCNYPLNGKLIIDSTPGKGTTLMIYTPLTH